MKKKQARIIYNEIFDSFDVETFANGDWELYARYICKASDSNAQRHYIHFGILRKIADLTHMGYKVEVLE